MRFFSGGGDSGVGDGDLIVVAGSGAETGAEPVDRIGGSVRAGGDNGGAGESARVIVGGEVGAEAGDANVSDVFDRSAGEYAASAAVDVPTTLSLTAFAPAKKPSMKSALAPFPP